MIKSKITAFVDWFCKFSDEHPTLVVIVCVPFAVIFGLLFGGWIFVYQRSTIDDDWTKLDGVFDYSVNMFAVVLLGFLVQVVFLFSVAMFLGAAAVACYYGWFIVLPLFLMFLSICFGRWLYIRKMKSGKIPHT